MTLILMKVSPGFELFLEVLARFLAFLPGVLEVCTLLLMGSEGVLGMRIESVSLAELVWKVVLSVFVP